MARNYHISRERLGNYILGLVRKNYGISTADLIANYAKDYGLARRGGNKTNKKREIIDQAETLRKLGKIGFEGGKWFYKI